MPRGNTPLRIATALLVFSGAIAIHAHGAGQAPTGNPSPTREDRTRALAKGKELFLSAGCVNCHNASGDKPLKTGLPLNERGLSSDEIATAVNAASKGRPKKNDEPSPCTSPAS